MQITVYAIAFHDVRLPHDGRANKDSKNDRE